jgi:hypothetical protein
LKKLIYALSLTMLLMSSQVFAQSWSAGSELITSYDFFANREEPEHSDLPLSIIEDNEPTLGTRKSPFVAGLLSLAVPGLGEYYVGDQIWRGVIFSALEVGLWYGNITYNNRGDDATTAFQDFAHKNWSMERYALYLNEQLSLRGKETISDPSDHAQINAAEDTLNRLDASLSLSHRLPPKGHQQYYELISKYNQYAAGWIDATCNDLSCSPLSNQHSIMRDEMNREYEIATNFLYGIFLNHVLSAIDAVLLANDHNSAIRVQGEIKLESLPGGSMEFQSHARLMYRF